MERRKFLLGVGGTAIGGSALLGTGAFSRVESQRKVTIQVAHDSDAYLGLKDLNTPNSENFVDYDDDGHIEIDIGDFGDETYEYETGVGVNSDSFTWFDGMFEICNQGKADITELYYELPEGVPENNYFDSPEKDPDARPDNVNAETVPTVAFYFKRSDGTRVIVEPDRDDTSDDVSRVPLELGTCTEMGVRTVTKGIDASEDTGIGQLIDGEVVVTADAPGAGMPNE